MSPRARFDKDYYRTLGVPAAATEDDLRRAYRRLALQCHPDRNPGNPRAEEQFKELSEAYGVLIDPVKRREYDLARQSGAPGAFRHTREDVFRDLFADPRASAVFEELRREFEHLGMRVDRHDFHQTLFGGRAVITGGVFVITPFTPVRLLFRLVGAALRAGAQDRAQIGDAGAGSAGASAQRRRSSAECTVTSRESQRSARPRGWLDRALRAGRWLLGTPADDAASSARTRTPGTNGAPGDIVMRLPLTRIEAERGSRQRITVDHDGRRDEILVTIPPGTRSGTRLRLRGKGGAGPNGVLGDLYLTVDVAG
jgi:curved DNA-binding protein CbpA